MTNTFNPYLFVTSISGLLAVLVGAFGAHGLKSVIVPSLLAVYQTGVQYHFYHVMAMLAVVILMLMRGESRALRLSFFGFLFGIILFSGSLYALAITGIRGLGAITPIGGLSFIFGWGCIIFDALTKGDKLD